MRLADARYGWAAVTVNRFDLKRTIMPRFLLTFGAVLQRQRGAIQIGFMWLDRATVEAERLQAAKKLQKEGILSKVQRDSAMANCGGGMMAEQSNQNRPVELPYRAGREDMRPKSGADLGCAVVFILIALLMLALIGFVVRYDWRRNGITGTSMLVIIGLGIFAAGSIIAACARLTRHRWWATRDWKEDWRPPQRR
jgi:hypothetical protein